MGKKSSADFKTRMAKRAKARKQQVVEEPDFNIEEPEEETAPLEAEEEEDATWGFLEPVETGDAWPDPGEELVVDEEELVVDEEEIEDLEALAEHFYDEGYNAFLVGVPPEANPLLEGDIEPHEPETALSAQAWEEGWYSALREKSVADVILSARGLAEAETEEVAEAMFQRLIESVEQVGTILDFEEYQGFWW